MALMYIIPRLFLRLKNTRMDSIIKLKKLKYIPDKDKIVIALQVRPTKENKEWIGRDLVFFPDSTALVTEQEAEWLLNIQKEHKFVEIMEE